MAPCPFYGFRWPDKSSHLERGREGECGLDFDENGDCAMEAAGGVPDYFRCPLTKQKRAALTAGRCHISFASGNGGSQTLEEWLQKYKR